MICAGVFILSATKYDVSEENDFKQLAIINSFICKCIMFVHSKITLFAESY